MLVSDVTKKVWRIWSVVSTLLCQHTTINIRHCSTAALQRGAQDRVRAVCSSCIMCLQSTCCVTLHSLQAGHCSTAALPGHEAAVSPLAVLHSAAAGLDCTVVHKNCMTFTHLQNQDLARTLVLKHLPSRRYNKMFIIPHKVSPSDTLYTMWLHPSYCKKWN